MNIKIGKIMSISLVVIFATLFVAAPAVASDFKHSNAGITVFEMPELDIQKTYTYNTTVDFFVPERIGEEAVLYWGEKAEIAGERLLCIQPIKIRWRRSAIPWIRC